MSLQQFFFFLSFLLSFPPARSSTDDVATNNPEKDRGGDWQFPIKSLPYHVCALLQIFIFSVVKNLLRRNEIRHFEFYPPSQVEELPQGKKNPPPRNESAVFEMLILSYQMGIPIGDRHDLLFLVVLRNHI